MRRRTALLKPEIIEATQRRPGTTATRAAMLGICAQAPLKAEPTTVDQLMMDSLQIFNACSARTLQFSSPGCIQIAVFSIEISWQLPVELAVNARDAIPVRLADPCDKLSEEPMGGGGRCQPLADGRGSQSLSAMPWHYKEVLNRVFERFYTTKPKGRARASACAWSMSLWNSPAGTLGSIALLGAARLFSIRLPDREREPSG